MVTPSLVIVGAPHFLSITTLRPFGPSVTLTASASLFTPRSSALRAWSSNCRVLAIWSGVLRQVWVGALGHSGTSSRVDDDAPRARGLRRAGTTRGVVLAPGRGPGAAVLLLDDGEHVTRGQDEVLLAAVLDLRAAVLAVDHGVADGNVERHAGAVLEPARTHGENSALLGLLLRGVRDDQARRSGLLGVGRLDHDAVLERLDGNLGGRRHLLTPSRRRSHPRVRSHE